MDENKCCENYASSYAKDMDSFCVREFLHDLAVCDKDIDHHVRIINGWTELTTDNADEINADLIVVTDGTFYRMSNDWHASLSTLAKVGGYYFFILPELKVEK